MILTTEQQAYNFALYALVADPLLQELDHESLLEALKSNIWLVFGNHTFTDVQVNTIASYAINKVDYQKED